jgi:hypothetical protein
MSYLAMSAETIDNDNNQNIEGPINMKRRNYNHNHTKTQKYRQNFNQQKVNSVLESIHNNIPDDDSELGNYNSNHVSAKHSENFKPLNPFDFPAKPVSVGGERTKKQEGMTTIDESMVPQPADDDALKLQELQSAYMNDAQVRDYYRKMMPTYNTNTNTNTNTNNNAIAKPVYSNDSNQVLIEKLNYMINLLEEQQDQKTGSVTEEVVLYSFLGVFIIFIVDSFAKVGKYTR